MALLNGKEILFSARHVQVKEPQEKLATPATEPVDVYPDPGHELARVTVAAVDSSIDVNIQPQNLLEGVSILGVEGTDPGFEAGKTKEWSDFWDEFQQNGKRTAYNYTFARPVWNDKTFRPKYDIVPTGTPTSMFYQANISNLKERLEEMGVALDTSQVTSPSTMFYETRTACLPEIDLRGCDVLTTAFIGSYIPTIEKLILRDDGSQTFTQTFQNAILLENIVIEGVIGKTFSMSNSGDLTVDSMKSVISALKNYAGTAQEGTQKISFHTTAWARLEASGAAPGGGTWKEYVQSLGWSI